MKRRDFHKGVFALGLGASTAGGFAGSAGANETADNRYLDPMKKLPIHAFDVVVVGGGTAGVVAAIAAARRGAKTALIEGKGYTGGTVTEGGTALHSFYNLWKAFPGVKKRQVVRGIAQEIVDRLAKIGLVTMEMLDEAGVHLCLNTMLVGANMLGQHLRFAIVESINGREAFYARSFVDCTAYGDLAAHAGAAFTSPNDYPVCNSIGVGNIDVDRLHDFVQAKGGLRQCARGMRSGEPDQIVRLSGMPVEVPEFCEAARKLGLSMMTTTVHDNYLMFLKLNMRIDSPLDRDCVSKAELQIRRNQYAAVELLRKHIPGCEKAFITRTSPKLCIRRGRLIECDYCITHEDVVEGRHFDDDVFTYGFHDSAPRIQIKDGGTYGIPYAALRVKGIENLLVSGMMITKDHRAHMSTRNTVCCMGQGQAAGTAAALCAAGRCGTRDLPYGQLRDALVADDVYFEET